MMWRAFALTAALGLVVVVASVACSRTRSADVKLAPAGQLTSEVPTARGATGPGATGGSEDGSPPALKPVDPLAGITGSADVSFSGEEGLLRWASGDEVEVAAHQLACLYDASALAEPARADARLQNIAEDLGVTLGRLRVVRVERPLTGLAPRPRICRPIVGEAPLFAPLFRVREPASRWRMKASTTEGAGAGLAAFVSEVTQGGATPASVPRTVVVRDNVVALALPVR